MTDDPGRVRMEIRDQVAVLTIDRPAKLNAFTPSMTAALMSHVTHVNEEPQVRAVVLTGTGRAFCAGSDIAGLDDYASPVGVREPPGLLRHDPDAAPAGHRRGERVRPRRRPGTGPGL